MVVVLGVYLNGKQLQTLLVVSVTYSLLCTCSSSVSCSAKTGKCSCSAGYKWSNTTNMCQDINECQHKKLNSCPASSTCLNTNGSYMCEIAGNQNPCSVSPCNNSQVCTEVNQAGFFTCRCEQWQKGVGNTCFDLTGCGICGASYTVVNETQALRSIATYCGIKVTTLVRFNPAFGRGSILEKGQSLNISCSGNDALDCGPCGVRYVASDEDNSTTIAEKCGILEAYLGISESYVGKIDIPCGVSQLPSALQCGMCGAFVDLLDGPSPLQNVTDSCNVTLDSVRSLNPALGEVVNNETRIYLPCNGEVPHCGPCGSSYRAQSNDTLGQIASKCLVNLSDILQVNPQIYNPDVVNPGNLFNIPCGSSLPITSSVTKMMNLQPWLNTLVFLACLAFIFLL